MEKWNRIVRRVIQYEKVKIEKKKVILK